MLLKDHIKNYFELLLFWIIRFFLPKPNLNKNSLLFINTGLIGDLIVSSVLLENPDIFNYYKKVRFLIKEQYLELFENYSGKCDFIGYNYKKYKYSLFYKFKFLSRLRQEGFNTCIHLTAARGILNEEITHLVGAKEIIVLNSFWEYLGNYLGRYFDKKYTTIIAKNILNEYDKHFELIRYLRKDSNTEITFNSGITFNEDKVLTDQDIVEFTNSIVIAPFSSLMNRNWKKKYFFEIIKRLNNNHKIILLGSINQKKELGNLCENNASIKILAGELKLNEIPSIIKRAKLYIGLDSGLTHIALKMGIPLIAIIGGGEFGRFFPYKESEKVRYLYSKMDCFLCHWECTKDKKYCIADITTDEFMNHIDSIFGSNKI